MRENFFQSILLLLAVKWAKNNRKHRCYLSFGNRCLQSVEIPMRFPRFSAVLAEFSTSTAENSKRLADFSPRAMHFVETV